MASAEVLPDVQKALTDGVVTLTDDLNKHYECCVCQKKLTGISSVDQHLRGAKHREAGAKYAIEHIQNAPRCLEALLTPRAVDATKEGVIIIENSNIKCSLCDVVVSGILSLEEHLNSDGHKQSVAMARTEGNQASGDLRLDLKDNVVILTDEINKHYECRVCQKKLTGIMQVDQHVSGGKHQEAMVWAAINSPDMNQESLREILPQIILNAHLKGMLCATEINGIRGFYCKVCSVPLSGVKPIVEHLKGDHVTRNDNYSTSILLGNQEEHPTSPIYKEEIIGQPLSCGAYANPGAIAEQNSTEEDPETKLERALAEKLVISTDNTALPYLCTICDMKFNSFNTLGDHLRSRKHKKINMEKELTRRASQGGDRLQPPPPKNSSRAQSYSTVSEPHGHVYIFNYTFTGNKKLSRPGSEYDSVSLKEQFEMMGYQVYIYTDLSGEKTIDTLKNITKDPDLNSVDSLIMFFLSHGIDPYTFYANDEDELCLFTIRSMFTDRKCPYMKGKPKIFFTNYCRGTSMQKKELDAPLVEVPNDMVTIHAAVEGVMAQRIPRKGTQFVLSLCEVLRECRKEEFRTVIYGELDKKMKERRATKPMWEDYGFNKLFYFEK